MTPHTCAYVIRALARYIRHVTNLALTTSGWSPGEVEEGDVEVATVVRLDGERGSLEGAGGCTEVGEVEVEWIVTRHNQWMATLARGEALN